MDPQIDFIVDEMLKGNFGAEGKSDIYLDFHPAIEGESIDAGHVKSINVLNFGFAQWQKGSSGKGGGSGASRAKVEAVRFTAPVSKAGPKILLACCKGERFEVATFYFRKSGGGQQDFLVVHFNNPVIRSYEQRLDDFEDGTKGIIEDVMLAFAHYQFNYKPQNPDGSLGSPLSVAFDLDGKPNS